MKVCSSAGVVCVGFHALGNGADLDRPTLAFAAMSTTTALFFSPFVQQRANELEWLRYLPIPADSFGHREELISQKAAKKRSGAGSEKKRRGGNRPNAQDEKGRALAEAAKARPVLA